jgi:hypothetical protein
VTILPSELAGSKGAEAIESSVDVRCVSEKGEEIAIEMQRRNE